jgi:hypothetical protein
MRRTTRAIALGATAALCACGASVQRIIPPLLQPPDDSKVLAPDDQRFQVELTYTALVWAAGTVPGRTTVYTPRDPSQLVGVTVEVRTAQTLTKRLRSDVDLEPVPVGDLHLVCDDQAAAQVCHYSPYQAIVSPEGQSISAKTGHVRIRVSYNASPAEIAAAAGSAANSTQSAGRRGIIEKEYCLSINRTGDPRTADQWTVAEATLLTPTSPLSAGPCARLGR